MSWEGLREALHRRLPADVPILEAGDIQHAVERLLHRRLPAACTVRVTPRRIRIRAASPAVRQMVRLLVSDIRHLLAEELQVPEREVQITQW